MKFKTEKTLSFLVAAFLLIIPFINSSSTVDAFLIPRFCLSGIFLLFASFYLFSKFKSLDQTSFSFIKSPAIISYFLLIAIYFISISYALNSAESLFVFTKKLSELLLLILFIFLFHENKINILFISKCLLLFNFIILIFSGYQLATLLKSGENIFENINLITSISANKNLFSSLLFLLLPFNFFLIFSNKKYWKSIPIFAVLFSLFFIWLLQTRAVWLSLLISSLSFTFLYIAFSIRKTRSLKSIFKNNKFAIIIVSALLITSVIFTLAEKKYLSKIHFTDIKHSINLRTKVWQNSLQIIKENPIGGVGGGNWQFHFPKYGLAGLGDDVEMGMMTYQRPHNDFLWVWAETGTPGIVLFLIFYLLILYHAFILAKKDSAYLSFFIGVIGYLIISFFDFPLERTEHQVILALITAFIFSEFYKNSTRPQNEFKYHKLLVSIFFIFSVFIAYAGYQRYIGELHTKKMYFAHAQNNWNKLIKEADLAKNNFYNSDPTSVPIDWYKGVALFAMNDFSNAQIAFENAYNLHPYNIHILNNLASCYQKLGNPMLAIEYYNRALAISPTFDEALLNESAVYFNLKDYDNAFIYIDKCSIESTNEKYKKFLPVILHAKVNDFLKKQIPQAVRLRLDSILADQSVLIETFFVSKRNNLNFERYILKP